jgi:hypothetical protein
MMDEKDARFNTPDYQIVTRIVASEVITVQPAGQRAMRVKIVLGENGTRYEIFPDWSAMELGPEEEGRAKLA